MPVGEMMGGIVIVGAGQAGAALAAKARALGYEGGITLFGDEPAPPYQRPPLSKAYLMGDLPAERLWLRSDAFYSDNAITLHLGKQVDGIDAAAKTISAGGVHMGYDHLVLATGATPRRLPSAIGGNLPGVFTVRNLADVDAMRPEFVHGRKLVVIGGGYIGLEAAAVARKLGLNVDVIEAAPRILARVAAPETSAYVAQLHRSHGVEIHENTALGRILGSTRATGVELSDGKILAADFVITGVGVTPNDALAKAAGLALDNGIATDSHGRTSDPNIWAAGDCASFPYQGGRIRLESVGNAIDQAEAVAANILGADAPYIAKPWFWSDQYDCKLQIAGLNMGYDTVITRGPEGEAVSFWYFKGDRLIAVDAMNDSRAYMVGKRLIETGKSPEKSAVADMSYPIKSLLS
jgi:3-phenylpropionate/trans-cinnamate dioxygenase ferredoxin reductase component